LWILDIGYWILDMIQHLAQMDVSVNSAVPYSTPLYRNLKVNHRGFRKLDLRQPLIR
jgi:hypothetical protein